MAQDASTFEEGVENNDAGMCFSYFLCCSEVTRYAHLIHGLTFLDVGDESQDAEAAGENEDAAAADEGLDNDDAGMCI